MPRRRGQGSNHPARRKHRKLGTANHNTRGGGRGRNTTRGRQGMMPGGNQNELRWDVAGCIKMCDYSNSTHEGPYDYPGCMRWCTSNIEL